MNEDFDYKKLANKFEQHLKKNPKLALVNMKVWQKEKKLVWVMLIDDKLALLMQKRHQKEMTILAVGRDEVARRLKGLWIINEVENVQTKL